MTTHPAGDLPPSVENSDFDPVRDEYQGITWDNRAERSGWFGAALDPADTAGRKNRYIDRLHRRTLRTVLDQETRRRGSMFDHALDYGCGGGRLIGELRRYARDVRGVDPSPVMISAARSSSGIDPDKVVLWRKGPLPFEDGFFDLFISVYVTLTVPVLELAASVLPRVCELGAIGVFIEQVDEHRGLTLEQYSNTLTAVGLDVESATPIRRSARSPFQRLATVAPWPDWVIAGLVRMEMAAMRWRAPKPRGVEYHDYAIVVRNSPR